jgi:hypothetical protein
MVPERFNSGESIKALFAGPASLHAFFDRLMKKAPP